MLERIEAKLFFKIIFLNVLILGFGIFISVSVLGTFAFSEPPPGSNFNTYNVPGPIDISSQQQTKQGAFFINNEFRANKFVDMDNTNFFFDPFGDISLKLNGDLDMTQNGIIADSSWPTDPTDIATKDYVDQGAAAQGW